MWRLFPVPSIDCRYGDRKKKFIGDVGLDFLFPKTLIITPRKPNRSVRRSKKKKPRFEMVKFQATL
jgi:hypothetical protein